MWGARVRDKNLAPVPHLKPILRVPWLSRVTFGNGKDLQWEDVRNPIVWGNVFLYNFGSHSTGPHYYFLSRRKERKRGREKGRIFTQLYYFPPLGGDYIFLVYVSIVPFVIYIDIAPCLWLHFFFLFGILVKEISWDKGQWDNAFSGVKWII